MIFCKFQLKLNKKLIRNTRSLNISYLHVCNVNRLVYLKAEDISHYYETMISHKSKITNFDRI